ncbi:Tetratricopeptide-like helical domain containing protein [Parasponia andersonii]|uniref:Tetratricopeptide-like helical domain containing protein n=1 Tax=Parasponia andersonii TaxID=3476 RepID=A0A2P5D7H7_PARAD|nr:Tetratricopeptide-like helical domain containing protein [Parasponia andersonii]
MTAMINKLKPHVRLSFHPWNIPNLRTEQSSNDYIRNLCIQKRYKEALEAFDFMEKSTEFRINPSTYAHLVSACSALRSLEHGKKVHKHIMTSKCQPDIVLQNRILNMYGKCGSVKDAMKVFDVMPQRNVVSWTSVISGCSQNGQDSDAVEFYYRMRQAGHMPDQFTFGSVLKACSGVNDAWLGRQLHANIVKSECGDQLIAQNALIAMYTKFGLITDASLVFSLVATKDLISWGSMIAGFSQLGYELEALLCFKEMVSQGAYQPNEFIFGSTFSACSSLLEPEYGRQIHGMCLKFGVGRDIFSGCSLSDMYAKCGFLESAKVVFNHIDRPDLVSWNAIISGFANNEDANEAILLFNKMRSIGFNPNYVTVLSLLSGCSSSWTIWQGKQVHSYTIKMGFDSRVPVCNSLLSMYAKCSALSDAFKVFEDISSSADSVSWNAMLTACTQHNQAGDVLRLFGLMLLSQIRPDHIALSNIVAACAVIASLEVGNQVHCFSMKSGLVLNLSVTNGLIDMYTKCGSLGTARKLFNLMENPDVVSWSSLIVGYAQFGYGKEALELFRMMRSSGVKPNEVTLLGVLTACSHVGLVEEGLKIFRTIEMEHGIARTREHCSCMVDLLARAGRLYEAEEFIKETAFDPDVVVWKTLLAACKTHGNTDIGKRAAKNIIKIDPSNSAAHVLLCSIYASSGRWEEVTRLRSLMKERGVKKVPGQSWIEVKGRIHAFLADDTLHPERDKIYEKLEELWLQMLDEGCDPLEP